MLFQLPDIVPSSVIKKSGRGEGRVPQGLQEFFRLEITGEIRCTLFEHRQGAAGNFPGRFDITVFKFDIDAGGPDHGMEDAFSSP